MVKQNNYVITIGRSFGSGGLLLAQKLHEHLEIPLFDKNILDKAAENSNIRKELFEKMDERNEINIPCVIGAGFNIANNFFSYTDNYLSNDHLFNIQAETIEQIAHRISAIFVGRCSDFVLRGHPHHISIFVSDTFEARIKTIQDRLNISASEAEDLINKMDKTRRNYYEFYTSGQWGAPDNYDLCLRLSSIGIENAVNIVVGLINAQTTVDKP